LLDKLSASKRAGEPWERAWEGARKAAMVGVTDPIERRGWPGVLDETESVWRAAYEGRRPGKDSVLASLGD
jgi:hypothetical protein